MRKEKLFSIIIIAAWLVSFSSLAQEEKKSVKLGLKYVQLNDQLSEVDATVKSKTGKKFEPVSNIEIEFFSGEQSAANSVGKAKTNNKGIASIDLPASVGSKLDSQSTITFTAYFSGNKIFEEQSAEIEITRSKIELKLVEVDSVKKVQAQLFKWKDGQWAEVPDTEMKLFVRRTLSDLSLTENALTTNENGEVSADFNFKTPIPGDVNGNIIIGAKVEDNDEFGTVVALKYAKWGTPRKIDRSFYQRSLFASRDKTPIWLLVFPNLVIVTVWGLILYMIYLIYRIRKVGLE